MITLSSWPCRLLQMQVTINLNSPIDLEISYIIVKSGVCVYNNGLITFYL